MPQEDSKIEVAALKNRLESLKYPDRFINPIIANMQDPQELAKPEGKEIGDSLTQYCNINWDKKKMTDSEYVDRLEADLNSGLDAIEMTISKTDGKNSDEVRLAFNDMIGLVEGVPAIKAVILSEYPDLIEQYFPGIWHTNRTKDVQVANEEAASTLCKKISDMEHSGEKKLGAMLRSLQEQMKATNSDEIMDFDEQKSKFLKAIQAYDGNGFENIRNILEMFYELEVAFPDLSKRESVDIFLWGILHGYEFVYQTLIDDLVETMLSRRATIPPNRAAMVFGIFCARQIESPLAKYSRKTKPAYPYDWDE